MAQQKAPRFDPWNDKTILTALAVAQALSLAYASVIVDGVMDWRVIISIARGLLMGGAVSFGMAVSAQRLGSNMAKTRRKIMIGVVIALFLVSPAIMAAGFWTMPAHVAAYHVLAVVGCDLAAAAVAVGGRVLAKETAEPAETSEKPAKKVAEPAGPVAAYACRCGWHSDVSLPERNQQSQWAAHKCGKKEKVAK